jgi:hypothetical protein
MRNFRRWRSCWESVASRTDILALATRQGKYGHFDVIENAHLTGMGQQFKPDFNNSGGRYTHG